MPHSWNLSITSNISSDTVDNYSMVRDYNSLIIVSEYGYKFYANLGLENEQFVCIWLNFSKLGINIITTSDNHWLCNVRDWPILIFNKYVGKTCLDKHSIFKKLKTPPVNRSMERIACILCGENLQRFLYNVQTFCLILFIFLHK